MSMPKRKTLLLGIAAILVLANLYVRLAGDGFETAKLWSGPSSWEYPAPIRKTIADIEASPLLGFRSGSQRGEVNEVDRNPFLFGVDRLKEEEQRRRMEALLQDRKEAPRMPVEAALPVSEEPVFEGKIIGIMKNHDGSAKMISVLLHQEIVILREGHRVDRYRLLEIGETHIRFLYLPDQKEIVINVE